MPAYLHLCICLYMCIIYMCICLQIRSIIILILNYLTQQQQQQLKPILFLPTASAATLVQIIFYQFSTLSLDSFGFSTGFKYTNINKHNRVRTDKYNMQAHPDPYDSQLNKTMQYLQQYNFIKQAINVNNKCMKLSIIFGMLQKIVQSSESVIQKNFANDHNSKLTDTSHEFLKTFVKLQKSQQAYFLLQLAKHAIKILSKNPSESSSPSVPLSSSLSPQILKIETTITLLSSKFKIPLWLSYSFKLDKNKYQIILTKSDKKKNYTIDLRNYAVRRSKKYKGCVVLEGFGGWGWEGQGQGDEIGGKGEGKGEKFVMAFGEGVGEEIFWEIFYVVIQTKKWQIQKIISSANIQDNMFNKKPIYQSKQAQQIPSNSTDSSPKNCIPSSQSSQNCQASTVSTSLCSSVPQKSQSPMVFLSSKNINQFQNYKEYIVKMLLNTNFKVEFKQISQLGRSEYKIQQSFKNQKLFKFQGNVPGNVKDVRANFLANLGNGKNKVVISSQILETFSGKYAAVYEKYLFTNKIQQLITIRQLILNTSNVNSQDSHPEQLLFIKGINNLMFKNFLDFLSVKVKSSPSPSPLSSPSIKLILLASISPSQTISIQKIKLLLYTLYENAFPKRTQILMKDNQLSKIQEEREDETQTFVAGGKRQEQGYANKQNKESRANGKEDEFQTVFGIQQINKDEEFMDIDNQEQVHQLEQEEYFQFVQGQGKQQQEQQQQNFYLKIQSKTQPKITQQNLPEGLLLSNKKISSSLQSEHYNGFLKYSYKLHPLPPQKLKTLMAEHYLFQDWTRRKQGGVICNNEQIINAQKKLFKDVLSKMGNSILKSGSILNISLPVTIFKKQSHLESIARDFCYAPILLEKPQTPLQRLKFSTLLAISVGTLGISMDKPFNPLLGETLQTWIDGCPMYLEQISHHPPIGAYFFVGRGYRIFGQIQPKISFGMNNVKGYSQRANFLVYDDEIKINGQGDGNIEGNWGKVKDNGIEMIYGKMIIHGLLFGEREFNFQDKIYLYYKKYNLFCTVSYGPRHKNIFKKSPEPWDFVCGKIYQVRQQFLDYFNQTHPRPYPTKQHIVKQISSFEGIWNDSIKFDGVQYINFRQCLPCKMEYEEQPICSNSLYRKDLKKLVQGDIQKSQEEKQRIEQIQRRDRKLRQFYQKTKAPNSNGPATYQQDPSPIKQPKLKKLTTA